MIFQTCALNLKSGTVPLESNLQHYYIYSMFDLIYIDGEKGYTRVTQPYHKILSKVYIFMGGICLFKLFSI